MAIGDPSSSNNDLINNLDAGLVYSDNCAALWKELQETYDKVDGFVMYNLLQKINTVKQGGSYVAGYYHRLNSIWREFDALTKLPKCTCEPIRSALLTRDPLLDVKDAYNTVSSEKSNKEIHESVGVSETKINATSFAVKSFNNNNFFNTNNNTRGSVSNDVLMVPGYCVSLLSVNKLIRDSKMFVGFDKEKCYIQDLTRQRILETSSESGGLYLFNMPHKCSLGESNMVMSFHVSKLLWHNRLGHPADQVLATLYNDLKIYKSAFMPVCEACHRDKQSREPFPLSNHKSKNLGKLVHLDLWGPYRVTSREGHIYFLTIVDDFSSLNDERRTSSVEDGSNPLPRHRFTDTTNLYQEEVSATHFDDQGTSEGNVDNSDQSPTQTDNVFNQDNVVLTHEIRRTNLCFATTLNKSIELSSYVEALKDNNWIEAMNNKIEALNRNNTWSICVLPLIRKPIGCKWLFKIKYKASGDIKWYKARHVAKGFSQREGFDYEETFSLVVKMVIVRCLVSIAVKMNWPLYQLDVNNAIMYGDVYMTLPQGFDNDNGTKVCKLNKSLYGLKQAPSKGSEFVALLVYVDDIVITRNDESGVKSFKKFLSTKF
ncbi:ribonuclease H-like domain-containing protein [Tanacetum coccineum]